MNHNTISFLDNLKTNPKFTDKIQNYHQDDLNAQKEIDQFLLKLTEAKDSKPKEATNEDKMKIENKSNQDDLTNE